MDEFVLRTLNKLVLSILVFVLVIWLLKIVVLWAMALD